MAPLPKRPERSAPVPNQPFSSPEVTSIKGPYWDMALGSGLEPDGNGSVQTSGSIPSEPTALMYGPNGFVGIGTGLRVSAEGEITACQQPPYGCNTYVDPYCVTDFSQAWYNCNSLTYFPLLDVSSGTNFQSAWDSCTSLTYFPLLDVSSGTNFFQTWNGCTSLISFPLLDVSNGTDFLNAWNNCTSLTSFPALNFKSGANFAAAWESCTSLTSFSPGVFNTCSATNFAGSWYNCALSQQSVDDILISLDIAGESNGTVNLNGGTSLAPGPAGLAAKASLSGKGWSVITN